MSLGRIQPYHINDFYGFSIAIQKGKTREEVASLLGKTVHWMHDYLNADHSELTDE